MSGPVMLKGEQDMTWWKHEVDRLVCANRFLRAEVARLQAMVRASQLLHVYACRGCGGLKYCSAAMPGDKSDCAECGPSHWRRLSKETP